MTEQKRKLSRGRFEQLAYIGIIAGVILLIIGGIGFGIIQYRYSKAQATYDHLSLEYVQYYEKPDSEKNTGSESGAASDDNQPKEIPWYEIADVDMVSLKNEYNNVVGWLYFEDQTINYPIMYSDNETYLTHAYDDSYSASGSIFLDINNHSDWDDPFSIIYGHNMKDGSMFRPLKNYQYQEYLDTLPYFQIITENDKYRYQIFAVNTVSMYSDYYNISYSRDSLLDSEIKKIVNDSVVKGNIAVNQNDFIVNLSTCSGSDNRLFVSAVRIDSYHNSKAE